MHETFMAEQIAAALVELVEQHQPCRLTRAVLKVGLMRQVVPELLRFALEAVLKETPAAGAEVVIESAPARGRCRACGLEFEVRGWNFVCPACQSGDVASLGGEELIIETVTLEKD